MNSHRPHGNELPLRVLLYRYLFFGWMFQVAEGSMLERAAARQFNRERCCHLPTYLRRWLVLVLMSYGLGVLLETHLTPGVAAALCYFVTTVSIAMSLSIARAWLALKYT